MIAAKGCQMIALIALLSLATSKVAAQPGNWKLIEVNRIWDRAPHNAFTDLIRFGDHWFCAFREGTGHVSDDGLLRVIRSEEGRNWTEVAAMSWNDGDVRDAKLSITAEGELMLNGAVRFLEPRDGHQHQSVTWFSADGIQWSEPAACPTGLGTWRWSVTWHGDQAYSFGYSGKDPQGCLYRSADGKVWEVLRADVYPDRESYGNETSLVFDDAGVAWCLLRRDRGPATALLGHALPPYQDWEWNDLGVRAGGPKMIGWEPGRFLATVRLYDGKVRTSLCEITSDPPQLRELLALPSGGDCSYAGMVWHENELWISYYSSHEGKSAIYLARVQPPTSDGELEIGD